MSKSKVPKKRNLSDLRPMEGNPRRVRDAGFHALVASISTPTFGVESGAPCALQPVIVNRHPDFDGVIVGGQRRWEAAAEAGFSEIWTHEAVLDRDQMREFCVRLNVPAGDWDMELLLPIGGESLGDWGFDDLDLAGLDIGGETATPTIPAADFDAAFSTPTLPAEDVAGSESDVEALEAAAETLDAAPAEEQPSADQEESAVPEQMPLILCPNCSHEWSVEKA